MQGRQISKPTGMATFLKSILALATIFVIGSLRYSEKSSNELESSFHVGLESSNQKLKGSEYVAKWPKFGRSLRSVEQEDSQGTKYSLGPKISDWDEQRAAYLRKHPGSNVGKNGGDRILMVTGSQPKICPNDVGDHFLLKSVKNKLDYCNPRGIEVFYNLASLDPILTSFWSKLPLLRTLMLAHPEVEWFWWMDSDAIFTDMSFNLPMEKYRDYNMVLHGWDELVYKNKDWVGLNTGSFLMRNTQWMLDLLDEWAVFGPKGKVREEAGRLLTAKLKGRPEFEADDQSALVWLLIDQKDRWASKTFLESSFYLHGYWNILVHKYEDMMEKHHPGLGDDRWPLVTHFVGCKPCGNPKELDISEFNRCFLQMERAYNFADNQILKAMGYEHVHLGTGVVRPRNASAVVASRSPSPPGPSARNASQS